MRRGFYFRILVCFFVLSLSPLFANKKTRIWSTDTVAVDSTPVKLVARLQYREWFKWKDLTQKKVNFYLDELLIGSAITESDGIARFLYLPSENGRWTLKVGFEGDSEYKAIQDAKSSFTVQIQGTPKFGFCSRCLQAFKTIRPNCLRCKTPLTFSEKEPFSIQNSLRLSSQVFFPLDRILGLCWVSSQKFLALTDKGLFLFDGYEFTAIPLPKAIATMEGLPSEIISFREDEAFFFIASQLVRWTPSKSLELWPLHNLFSQPGVRRLRAGNDKLWILGHKEVLVLEKDQLKPLTQIGSISLYNLQDLRMDPNQTIWIAKRDGLYFYTQRGETGFFPLDDIEELYWNHYLILRTKQDLLKFENQQFQSILPPELKNKPLNRVLYSDNGTPLYFLGEETYSPRVGIFSLTSPTQQPLPIHTALIHQEKNLWLGTRVGLVLLRLASGRQSYPLEGKDLTGWGLTRDQQLLLGTTQGVFNLKGERVSDLKKMKWLLADKQQQWMASSEKIVTPEETLSLGTQIEPILQGIEYQKQFFIVTEHSLYLKEAEATRLIWNTPAKILTVESGNQGIYLGTSVGLFRYSAGQVAPQAWAGNQPIFSIAETQNAIYAGGAQGVFSNSPGASKWLETQACVQLFPFQDRLYIRTAEQLYVLQNQKISQVSLSSTPLSIALGRNQPILLTQRGLELLPDFPQLLDQPFHFLLPQDSGWIGLSENQFFRAKKDGSPIEQSTLPEKMAGVFPLFSEQYLFWNHAHEWFLWKNQHCQKLESLEPLLKNPVTEVREEGIQLVTKTPQGDFVLTASGWEPHTQSQTSFVDNVGKEWKLQGNKLLGPQTTLEVFPFDQMKNFVKFRGDELWFFSGSLLLAYREGHTQSYFLKTVSLYDVLRSGDKIYCASSRGLFLLQKNEVQTISKETFTALEHDSFGNLWALGEKSLLRIPKEGESQPVSETFTKLVKHDQQLYFFHPFRGVFTFDGTQFKTEIPPLQNQQFTTFLPLEKKNGYWVGTQRGLVVYKNARFFPVRLFSSAIQLLKKTTGNTVTISERNRFITLKIQTSETSSEEVGTPVFTLQEGITDCLPLSDGSLMYIGSQGVCLEQNGVSKVLENQQLRFAQSLFFFENKIWAQAGSRLHVLDSARNEWKSAEEFVNRRALPSPNFKSILVFNDYTFFDYGHELYAFHAEKGMQFWKGPVFQERDKQFFISESHLLLLNSREGRLFTPEGRFEPWTLLPGAFKPVAFRYPSLFYLENNSQGTMRLVQSAQNGTKEWVQELTKEESAPKVFFVGPEVLIVSDSSIIRYNPSSGASTIWSQRKIYGAEQDPSGTLFVLELKGLYRYDSGKMTSVDVPVSNPFFIGKMPQGSLLLAGAKQLHILGTNYRLGKKEGFQGPIESVKPLTGDRILIRYLNQDRSILTQQGMIPLTSVFPIPSLAQDAPILESQGIVWYLQEGKIYYWEENKLRLCKLDTPIHALIKDTRGQVLGLGEKGLFQLPSGDRVSACPEEKIEQTLWSPQGVLCCSTRKKLGYLNEKEWKEIKAFTTDEEILKIFPGHEGALFALTTEGLASFSTQHFEYFYRTQALGNKKFSQGVVLRDGEILLGEPNGLFQIPKNIQKTIPVPPHGSGHLQILSEKQDLLICTGNGLFRLSPDNQLETIYSGTLRSLGEGWYSSDRETFKFDGTRLVLKHSFPCLNRFEISSEETLFVQSETILTQRGNALRLYQLSPSIYGSLIKNIFLLPEPYGFCVITDSGISFRENRCFKVFARLPFSQVFAVTAKKHHRQLFIWFSTNQGIFRFLNEEFLNLPPISGTVSDIKVFGDSLLVATPEQIWQYVQITDMAGQSKPIPFSKPFQKVQNILNQENVYWFCAPERFFRFTQKQLHKSIEISTRPYLSALTDSLGNLWIQYPDRLEYVTVEENPPKASILHWENFYNGKLQIKVAGKDSFFESDTFEFSYRLTPVSQKTEEKWSPFQAKPLLSLSAPERERYRLEVRAKDESGNIQPDPTIFDIDLSELIFQNQ